jgi:hypothetical protein
MREKEGEVELDSEMGNEETKGLMKVLENKHDQIQKLQKKIKNLENDQNTFSDKKFSKAIEEMEFMSYRKG